MKKIFTLSFSVILAAVLLAGCSKRGGGYYGNDEDYWLSQENGMVVYSDTYCPYYVVETYYGYTIIESVNGYLPYENDMIYGNLSRTGYSDLYNRSDRRVVRGRIVDYWLTYAEAQYMIDDLCYYGYKSGEKAEKKTIKQAGILKEQKRK